MSVADAGFRYPDAVVVDGLLCAKFDRDIFLEMKAAGITAANCTCSFWEDFAGTMRNVAQWKRLFRENTDIIVQVRVVDDILRAKADGRVGIILGWQNTSGIDDNLDFLEVFAELGIRVVQLTYNTQNLVGSGCYEHHDGGLSGFGRDVVSEMNRLGLLVDLSHVGELTAAHAVDASRKPVAYTHCCPRSLKDHPRNKSDETMRKIVDRGGYVGLTMFPPFLAKGTRSTVDDVIDVADYLIDLLGEEHVGIGTDMSQGQPWSWQEWLMHDKGHGRRLTTFGELTFPAGIETIADFPNLADAMVRKGWPGSRIERVLGQNWLRLLRDVW